MASTVPQEVREIIRAKKHLYCRSVDAKDWDLFDKVALPDARLAYRHQDGRFVTAALKGQDQSIEYNFGSRDEFKDFFRKTFSSLQTIHMVDGGYFEPGDAPDEVKVVFICMEMAGPADTTSEGHGAGGGHYHEVYKKVGDDWLMKSCDFVVLYHRV